MFEATYLKVYQRKTFEKFIFYPQHMLQFSKYVDKMIIIQN